MVAGEEERDLDSAPSTFAERGENHQLTPALPRLLYVGSVQASATSAGALQLHRLLDAYPPGKLRIVEVDCDPSEPSRRLAGVPYAHLSLPLTRGIYFARTRRPRTYWRLCHLHAAWRARRALRLVAPFKPEAVLTIHEGVGWLAAAKLAKELEIPLHIISHDDWFRNMEMAEPLKAQFETYFGEVYRRAVTRLSVSPFMEADCFARYGARGTVLYPIQSKPPAGDESILTFHVNGQRPLTLGYAGNVYNPGNWKALQYAAIAAQACEGRLVLFGPDNAECARHGLTNANVDARGMLDQSSLSRALKEEVDVLFLPMSFDASDERNMQLCFPSKLADYCATRLPILIYSPPYSSAVRWAEDNRGVCELVTAEGADEMTRALSRLRDSAYRAKLGQRSWEVGRQYFSAERGHEVFYSAMRSGVRLSESRI